MKYNVYSKKPTGFFAVQDVYNDNNKNLYIGWVEKGIIHKGDYFYILPDNNKIERGSVIITHKYFGKIEM